MTDIRLVYDSVGRRWEGLIQPISQWSSLDQYNEALTIAYGNAGAVAGFVFDLDLADSQISGALERIRELFGEIVAERVAAPERSSLPDFVVHVPTPAVTGSTESSIFPLLGRLNSRAREVQITEDKARGMLRVSMRLPWWARFSRPWVTVRRRGRPEVIALGPLRRAGATHTADLFYGLPTSSSSLVTELISGTRRIWATSFLAGITTAVLLLGGMALRDNEQTRRDTTAAVETTAAVVDTTVAVTTTTSLPDSISVATSIMAPIVTTSSAAQKPVTTTTPIPLTTSVPVTTTTASTILPPGGVNFDEPNQYITANDVRANVSVSRDRVAPGDAVDVSVRISGVFINPFFRTGITELADLVNACRSLIGVKTTTPPTPGWSTNVSVSLAGTNISAGGFTTLVVVGNIARECGNYAVIASPLTIDVVRLTLYREVPMTLQIPRSLKAGTYELMLDGLDLTGFTKTTPITLTVTG